METAEAMQRNWMTLAEEEGEVGWAGPFTKKEIWSWTMKET